MKYLKTFELYISPGTGQHLDYDVGDIVISDVEKFFSVVTGERLLKKGNKYKVLKINKTSNPVLLNKQSLIWINRFKFSKIRISILNCFFSYIFFSSLLHNIFYYLKHIFILICIFILL